MAVVEQPTAVEPHPPRPKQAVRLPRALPRPWLLVRTWQRLNCRACQNLPSQTTPSYAAFRTFLWPFAVPRRDVNCTIFLGKCEEKLGTWSAIVVRLRSPGIGV